MNTSLKAQKISLGVCYYPEHWPREIWAEDLERMLEAGIETVRIAEFAWSKFEPHENTFTFDFFDEFLDLAHKMGMKVIFCTPTATPPAWLTTKYPEVLNANKEGVLYRHGSRRHYNYNSSRYRAFTERIVEKIASHVGSHPAIVGWQIDNELNCETDLFYSESDSVAFRRFLERKYGSLEQLNHAWGTVFWNQTYTDWTEIFVPRMTASGGINPHQSLDFSRFISDSLCSYAKLQSDILRKYIKPGDFITTNGMFANVDNHRLTEESLDFYTFDSYPNFAYLLHSFDGHSPTLRDRMWSRILSEVRSVSPIFGIMEQQSGANGWNNRMEAPTPKPGQMTLWTVQSIAHGADFVSYFRWRTCTFGTEIYWHGILDYSGRENRRIRELREIHLLVQRLEDVAGAEYEARVAIVRDYDNIWDSREDTWHRGFDEISVNGLYEAAQLTHTPVDFVYMREGLRAEDLRRYEVVFVPHGVIADAWQAKVLEGFVSAGGTVVFGCRAGYKNPFGHCVTEKLPGVFRDLSGTDVVEYSLVSPADGAVRVDWDGDVFEAVHYNDVLEPLEGGQVLARYLDNDYSGAAALIEKSTGKGRALYYGATFSPETARLFLEKLGVAEPYADLVKIPECVEIAVRVKDGIKYMFLLNYSREEVTYTMKVPAICLQTDAEVSGARTLRGYGVDSLKFLLSESLRIAR